MRTNWSYVWVTAENIDEIEPLTLHPTHSPNVSFRKVLNSREGCMALVWDPYEKYQIHPNFRGVRRGL